MEPTDETKTTIAVKLPSPFKLLSSSSFPKLRHGNYADWEYQMKGIFRREKLLDFLGPNNPKLVTDAKDWDDRNEYCLLLIQQSLSQSQLILAREFDDAFDLLEKLRKTHVGSTSRFDALFEDVMTLTQRPGETGFEMGQRQQATVMQMMAAAPKDLTVLELGLHLAAQRYLQVIPKVCFSLLNEDHGIATGNSPEALSIRVRVIEDNHDRVNGKRPRNVPSYDDGGKIRQSDVRDVKQDDYVKQEAFSATEKTRNQDWKKNVVCHHCSKKGHIKRECKTLERERKEEKDKETASMAVAMDDAIADSSDSELCFSTSISPGRPGKSDPSTSWLVDSGCTKHMAWDRRIFASMVGVSTVIQTASGSMRAHGEGNVRINLPSHKKPVTIKGVLWVPGLTTNLLSVAQLTDTGVVVQTTDVKMTFERAGKKLGTAIRTGMQYLLHAVGSESAFFTQETVSDAPIGEAIGRISGQTPQDAEDTRREGSAETLDAASASHDGEDPWDVDNTHREASTRATTSGVNGQGDDHPGVANVAHRGAATEGSQDQGTSGGRGAVVLWHRRLGHPGIAAMMDAARRGIIPASVRLGAHGDVIRDCEICAASKSTRIVSKKTPEKTTKRLELIHMDLWGSYALTNGHGGNQYMMTVTDDFTRVVWVRLVQRKGDLPRELQDWRKWAEAATNEKLLRIRMDNAREHISASMKKVLEGVLIELTTTYHPEQNGVAERMNRTLIEKARCMLRDAELPREFWEEAVTAAAYIHNRMPIRGRAETPLELWSGRPAPVGHLKPFGCVVYSHIPREARGKDSKLTPRAWKGILVGYVSSTQWSVWDPAIEKTRVVSDAKFLEDKRWGTLAKKQSAGNKEDGVALPLMGGPSMGGPSMARPSMETPPMAEPSTDSLRGPGGDAVATQEPAIARERGQRTHEVQVPSQRPASPESVADRATEESVEETLDERAEERVRTPVSSPSDEPRLSPKSGGLEAAEEDGSHEGEEAEALGELGELGETIEAQETETETQSLRRSSRVAKPTKRYDAYLLEHALSAIVLRKITEPTSYRQAVEDPIYGKEWLKATQEELARLIQMGTWEPANLPEGKNAVSCKWVFKVKYDELGNVSKFKARLVARGFTQQEGIDYYETFAPTVKFDSLRLLFAIAARFDLEIHQLDVISAYLAGTLEEEVFMQYPEGYPQTGFPQAAWGNRRQRRLALRLLRSLYGLKQSARVWYQRLAARLVVMGFRVSQEDQSVFIRGDPLRDGIVIAVYVDDMLFIGKNLATITSCKQELAQDLDTKDLGEVSVVLGIRVTRDREKGLILLDQEQYCDDVLERHGMADCSAVSTPMEPGTVGMTSDAGDPANQRQYQQAIGSLMYLMVGTRPDIAFAVGKLSRFSSAPKTGHMAAVKRVFRYLRGTAKTGIRCHGDKAPTPIIAYCDSDFAGDTEDRRSTGAYLFVAQGMPVAWRSKKTDSVALSTTEAEYMALCEAARHAVWTRRFLKPFRLDGRAIQVLEDNQSAIRLAKNPVFHSRTKHVDVKFHFTREALEKGIIEITYCKTGEMLADALTKPLPRPAFVEKRQQMGCVAWSDENDKN